MDICLMPDIPNNFIRRHVKDPKQRNRQLHDAKIGRKVAAVLFDRLNQQPANLRRELF